jgi:hypothetical protein
MFQNHAINQIVSGRPFIVEAQSRSQASPCVFCGGQIGTGRGYPSSAAIP